MTEQTPIGEIDRLIDAAVQRAEALRSIRALLADEPELFDQVMSSLGYNRNGQAVRQRKVSGKPTHFQKIQGFFDARQNTWTTAPDIMQATSLSRGAVAHILYKTHQGAFQKKTHPTNRKVKLWRLKGGDAL